MRLLFIKLKHIGDALLLTPTLRAVRSRHPKAEIHVIVRRGTEGILQGCTAIDQLWTTDAPESKSRSWKDLQRNIQLVRNLRQLKFDWTFELTDGDRGRWLSLLSHPKHSATSAVGWPLQWIWRKHFSHRSSWEWRSAHRVQKDLQLVHETLGIPNDIPSIPPLEFDPSRQSPHHLKELSPGIRYVVLHPATRWDRKKWPESRWIELGRWLLTQTDCLVLSSGAAPAEIASTQNIADALGPRCLLTQGKLDWSQMATLLRGSHLFVGVDTAAMHLAAACQTPTVALFGPSNELLWSPWKTPHRLVKDPLFPHSTEDPMFFVHVEQRRMDPITVDAVIAASDQLFQKSQGEPNTSPNIPNQGHPLPS